MLVSLAVGFLLHVDAGAGCTSARECRYDEASSTCGLGSGGGPVNESGTTCRCAEGKCQPLVIPPVPCKSFRDCSLSREPVTHPVSSKEKKREHAGKVRPCKDAERDSICDEQTHTCRVVAWKC